MATQSAIEAQPTELAVTTGPVRTLRDRFAQPGAFVVAAEIVTSRGLISADGGGRVLSLARQLAADARVHVLPITDTPGGHARELELSCELVPEFYFFERDPETGLLEIAYVCPESQRAKSKRKRPLRRGPGGPVRGVRHGVHLVAGVRAAEGMRGRRSRCSTARRGQDNALAGTSAWANTFLDRDHVARQQAGGEGRSGTAS
ncbi:MAG TPA: hypothetical protein VFO26_17710 [Gaiella sp.]|nr:hypothetical protein [Gaiella sp.]HET9289395.1 hypothetical protein [Gaiella sp.]